LRECIEALKKEQKKYIRGIGEENVAIINKVIDREVGIPNEKEYSNAPLSKSPNTKEDIEI
jgi:hypothetical protein